MGYITGICPSPTRTDPLNEAYEQAEHSFGEPDVINSPKHYAVFEDLEAIEIIASIMNEDQFYGYCLGNTLKYRLRAGNKDKLEQDINKAEKYKALFTEHKHLCRE